MPHISKRIVIICVLYAVPVFPYAQRGRRPEKEIRQTYREARKYFRRGDFRDAIPLFEEVQETYNEDAKFNYQLGISYLHNYAQPKDLEYLEKTVSIDPKVDKQIYYWLGRANHLNYNFTKAREFYETHKARLKSYQKWQTQEIDNLIEQSKYAKYLCEIPQRYIIEKVEGGINTEYSEHSPITTMDGSTLIYTSRHPNDQNNTDKDEIGQYLEKIYMTTKNDSGQWQTPRLLNIDPDFKNHLATMQLMENGTKMLLYKSTHRGDVYVSSLVGGSTWSAPVPYENINSPDFEADVYRARNDDILFLSTDRFNKDGNLDIYMLERQEDGSWGELISVGDSINTPFDENSPFVSNDGNTLYFSSNGHRSMGGYDVFRSERDTITGEWGAPKNMGYPINTPDDDVYFYFGYNGWTGYTSSYRTGGKGEKDLYKITFAPNVNIAGRIFSGESMELIKDVDICFEAAGQDTSFVECDLTREKNGEYNVNVLSNQSYEVFFTLNGDTLDKKTYTVPFLVEGDPVFYAQDFYLYKDPDTSALDSIPIEEPVIAMLESESEKTIVDTVQEEKRLVRRKIERYKGPELADEDILRLDKDGNLKRIRNLYFPFDSYKFEAKYYASLDDLAEILKNQDVIVKIVGHADDKGSASYNNLLSKKRAQSVKDYLVTKQVDADKMIVKNMGFKEPLVSNDDEVDGRELNRRVEFKVYRAVN